MAQKRRNILRLITLLFVFLFVYAASVKLLEFRLFQFTLRSSPLIGEWATIIAIALPFVELALAILLLFPRSHAAGIWGTFLLMALFTAYVGYMIMFEPHLPCSCGGILKELSWKQHLLLNTLLTLVAALGCVLVSRKGGVPSHDDLTQSFLT